MNSLSSVAIYVFLTRQIYFVFFFFANNFGNCTHVYNANEGLSLQPQIFDICMLYLFSQTYDPLSIPYLTVIFSSLQMPMKFLLQFINISHLVAIYVLPHQ